MQKELQNISTYTWGKRLFLSIDLSKTTGRSKSGKSTNIAASRGYRMLQDAPGLRLNLHLYRLASYGGPAKEKDPALMKLREEEADDLMQLVAIASGLTNQQREKLMRHVSKMIIRDSTI